MGTPHRSGIARRIVVGVLAIVIAGAGASAAGATVTKTKAGVKTSPAERAAKASARATAKVRAKCRANAKTAAALERCAKLRVGRPSVDAADGADGAAAESVGINPTHMIICHHTGPNTLGRGGWNAIPPSSNSGHLENHSLDYVIYYSYPAGTPWNILNRVLDAECAAQAPTSTTVTPRAPTFTEICGTAKDTYTVPTTAGVVYRVNGAVKAPGTYAGTGTVTIVAEAVAGYRLTGTTTWTHTFTNAPCGIEVTAAAPTQTPVCGANNDGVSAATTGVSYDLGSWSGGSRTVTASAQDGYVLTGTTSWTLTDNPTAGCMTVTPAAPTQTPVCGANNDTVTASTQGVIYDLGTWSGGSRTVTASPDDGVVLTGTTSWTLTDDPTAGCATVTPVRPTQDVVCGPINDVITIVPVEGVTYITSPWDPSTGTRTVTAEALEGYELAPGEWTWTFTDANTPCQVTPSAPLVTPVCGIGNDSYVTPNVTGITYTASWIGNTLTITASANAGFEIPASAQRTWTFVDNPTAGCTTTGIIVSPPGDPATTLTIDKTGASTASARKTVTYTIRVRNSGTAVAKSVVISDRVPTGMSLVAVPKGAKLRSGVVRWTIGDLQPGATRAVRVTLRLNTNRTTRRCNTSDAVGTNAPTASDTACTRFTRVAGVSIPRVTG